MARVYTKDDRVWRANVIRRDTRCIICNSIKDREAHHLNDYSYHPEERYVVSNGVTLCNGCHTLYHCDYNRSFRVKTTKKNFEEFIKVVNYVRSLSDVNLELGSNQVLVTNNKIDLEAILSK